MPSVFFSSLEKKHQLAACFVLRKIRPFPSHPSASEGFSYQPGIAGFDGAGDSEFGASVCDEDSPILLDSTRFIYYSTGRFFG